MKIYKAMTIKLKNLIEAKYYSSTRGKKIDDLDIKQFTSEYGESLKAPKLYRGYTKNNFDIMVLNPKLHVRVASDTNNFYTFLIDTLPSWKHYPKRSKSIIFSTSEGDAGGYGDYVYVVFLKNGSKIAMCPKADCWGSFDYISARLRVDLNVFSKDFGETFELFGIQDGSLNLETWNVINNISKNDFKAAHDFKAKYKSISSYAISSLTDDIETRLQLLPNNKWDWMGYFDDLLNPQKNNIISTTIGNLSSSMLHRSVEGWSDGEATLIRVPYYNEIISNLINSDN
jgi:hypothetical protein